MISSTLAGGFNSTGCFNRRIPKKKKRDDGPGEWGSFIFGAHSFVVSGPRPVSHYRLETH